MFSHIFKTESIPLNPAAIDCRGFSHVFKRNPYHDALGRFSDKAGARFVSLWARTMPSLTDVPAQNKREYKDIFDKPLRDGALMREFDSMHEAHKDYLDNIPQNQLDAVRAYTGSFYEQINDHLRGIRQFDDKIVERVKETSTLIDKALDGREVGVDLMGYRGIGGDHGQSLIQSFEDGTLIGTTLQDPGYVSSSVSKQVAKDWSSEVNLHMKIRKEQKGLYVGSKPGDESEEAEKYTKYPTEHEIVLPRDIPMIVTGAYKDKDDRLIVEVDVLPGEKKNPPGKKKKKTAD